MERPNIWIDITNPPHLNFFGALMRDRQVILTTRAYSRLPEMLAASGRPFTVHGGYYGGALPLKVLGYAVRAVELSLSLPRFDLAVSHGSPSTVHVARIRRRPAVWFTDMDIPTFAVRTSIPRLAHIVTPDCIPRETLLRLGARRDAILQYPGFKEEVYLAGFEPDPGFLSTLPFQEYALLRGEAHRSEEAGRRRSTILREIVRALHQEGVNTLFLPRYEDEAGLLARSAGVHIPPPTRALDACWHAMGVITGSTTLAKEAALMGVPAVSFFPGERLQAVDAVFAGRGDILFSRDVKEIVHHVLTSRRRKVDTARFARTRDAVRGIFDSLVETGASA